MAEQENGRKQETLAEILKLPTWTREQAARVVEAQSRSGLSQARYAAQQGFSVGRLYNWKSKLRAKLRTAPTEAIPERESESESESESEKESKKELKKGVEPQDFGLNLQRSGERFVHDYLLRATRGQEAMWRLFSFRRHGAALLCVVQWLHKIGKTNSYSLVTLELEEPALRWQNFPSVEAAERAMEACERSSVPKRQGSLTPHLVPVQVRDSGAERQAESFGLGVGEDAACMTLSFPSGVRMQMTEAIPKRLLRAILRAIAVSP